MDEELKENLIEHITLQEARRVIINRIAIAKQYCEDQESEICALQSSLSLAANRVSGWGSAGVASSSSSTIGGTSVRKDSAGKVPVTYMDTSPDTGTSSSDDDSTLRANILKITGEIILLSETMENNTTNLKLDADIEEYSALRNHLIDKVQEFTELLDHLHYERDMMQEKLALCHPSTEQNELMMLKGKINNLRMKLFSYPEEIIHNNIVDKTRELEIQMIRNSYFVSSKD